MEENDEDGDPTYWRSAFPHGLPSADTLKESLLNSTSYHLISPPEEYEKFCQKFTSYSSDTINLDRGGAYTIAPKDISIRGMLARMWAFLGFANTQFGSIESPEECYERPEILLSLIVFLKVSCSKLFTLDQT